jgi:hypothetical protein
MPVQVTEQFAGKGYSLEAPWSATRSFMVTGVDNDYDALRATDYQSGLKVPQADEAITPGSPILCRGPSVPEVLSNDVRIIRCQYAIPADGTWAKNDLDPLKEPPEVQWDPAEISFPVDVDVDGRPIVNTAGDPFEPPTRRIKFKRLTIVRNELYFNLAKSTTFEDSVNSTAVSLSGVTTVVPNYMLCTSIGPAERYKSTAKYVKMAYQFDIMFSKDLGAHPWQWAFLNVGRNGWATVGGKKQLGAFATQPSGANTTVYAWNQDIRLALTGAPITSLFPDIKVQLNGDGQTTIAYAPETPPSGSTGGQLATEEIKVGSTLQGYRLFFRQFKSADHNLIGL